MAKIKPLKERIEEAAFRFADIATCTAYHHAVKVAKVTKTEKPEKNDYIGKVFPLRDLFVEAIMDVLNEYQAEECRLIQARALIHEYREYQNEAEAALNAPHLQRCKKVCTTGKVIS